MRVDADSLSEGDTSDASTPHNEAGSSHSTTPVCDLVDDECLSNEGTADVIEEGGVEYDVGACDDREGLESQCHGWSLGPVVYCNDLAGFPHNILLLYICAHMCCSCTECQFDRLVW